MKIMSIFSILICSTVAIESIAFAGPTADNRAPNSSSEVCQRLGTQSWVASFYQRVEAQERSVASTGTFSEEEFENLLEDANNYGNCFPVWDTTVALSGRLAQFGMYAASRLRESHLLLQSR